jgi:acyl-CoA thioesterase-2
MTDVAPGLLMRLLGLRPLGSDSFEAVTVEDGTDRLFGGQVAAQTLRATTLTVGPERPVHSLHAYFVRPGRPGLPLVIQVERTRDGRSFTTRRATARQGEETIFDLTASFQAPEPGYDWHLPGPLDVPDPDALPSPASRMTRYGPLSPFELRPVRDPGPEGFPAFHPFWVRAREALPEDPALHACALAFMSDMGVVPSSRAPGRPLALAMGASLDHAVWFHRPARADDWLLFTVEPVSNHGSRALARGTLHDRQGRLVMSMTQETLLRT